MMNFTAILVAAFIPLIIGFVWYGPLFGKIWMKECGFVKEDLQKGNFVKILLLSFFFSILLSSIIPVLTIHQMGAFNLIGGPGATTVLPSYDAFMADYGSHFRTFKHGVVHGVIAGLFFALPLIAINGLFERKSWKYILIHTGYWVITLAIMGGIICAWK